MPGCCGVACLRKFISQKIGKRSQSSDEPATSKFILEQHRWCALGRPLVILQREQSKDMGHGRLELRNDLLHPPAEKGVENHGRNADRQTGRGVDQSLADTAREEGIAGG